MDNKLSAFLTDEKNPKPLRYLLLVGVRLVLRIHRSQAAPEEEA